MSERERTRTAEAPRSDEEREWEVFVRPTADEPARHVGSVTAPSADVAHEQASMLFDPRDIWLCPADEVRRYSTEALGEQPATDSEADA